MYKDFCTLHIGTEHITLMDFIYLNINEHSLTMINHVICTQCVKKITSLSHFKLILGEKNNNNCR